MCDQNYYWALHFIRVSIVTDVTMATRANDVGHP